jgi:cobalt-zinc-cadmium efflux system membrane fusion protein
MKFNLNSRVILIILIISFCACNSQSGHNEDSHGHDDEQEEQTERGAHGGRLFKDQNLTLELQIYEQEVEPEFRAYLFKDSKQIETKNLNLSIKLKRLGENEEIITFKPVADFLKSDQIISEPHSFDAEIVLNDGGGNHLWKFSTYEGRTEIPSGVAKASGIMTENAGSRTIENFLRVRGKILPSEHRIAHVIPRFSGIVKEGRKHIGDKVEKGEVLAIIESNQSLQPFEVRSQISGTVINGHLVVGEFVPENQWVFVIADLSELWADFFVPLGERYKITIGQKVIISTLSGQSVDGKVFYIAPYADEKSQSQLVRVILPNQAGEFLPGMFITGDIVISKYTAQVAVNKNALQRFRDWNVVFIKVGDQYEIRPVELGQADSEYVELRSGLRAGQEYVAKNSFVIKSDILKSGAAHDH